MHRVHHVFARDAVTGTRLTSAAGFSRHSHDAYGIGVIERGAQKSWSGRGTVEAGPGDVITVNPGEVHDGAPLGARGRRWRMLYFKPEILAGFAGDGCGDLAFTQPVFADCESVRRLFLALYRQLAAGGDVADIGCEQIVLQILPRVCSPLWRITADAPVHRARACIDDHPERAVKLGELARLCGTTKFGFLRAFTRATGLTPHAYIVQRRLQRAKRLIEAGEPIAAAAAASGFADQSHLTRTFVRSYGYTPGYLRP